MAKTPKPEWRRWNGGMKPVGRPKYEPEPATSPPAKEKPKDTRPLQKGTGEESVE